MHPPVGGIVHLAWWEGEDCHGLDVWDSEQAWARFGEDRLGPGMGRLGLAIVPEATFVPIHEAFVPEKVKIV